MKKITVYQTSDGKMFLDDLESKKHQQDIVEKLLDDFIPYDDRGKITGSDKFNILMKITKDPKLKSKINALYQATNNWV